MADEYTPTTEQVVNAVGSDCDWIDPPGFDRWLAEHDAEICEQIAREIEAKAATCHLKGGGPCGSLWRRGLTEAAAIARGAK